MLDNNFIDQAFDYRGDVTIDLTNGLSLTGYIFNRDHTKKTLEVFASNNPTPMSISYDHIKDIRFTGVDTAAGKSWEAWQTKKARDKTT